MSFKQIYSILINMDFPINKVEYMIKEGHTMQGVLYYALDNGYVDNSL